MYLSDGEAKAIVDDAMVPRAKAGDLDGALIAALGRIDAVVVPGGNPAHATTTTLFLLAGMALGFGGVLLFVYFAMTWVRRGRDAEVPLIDDSVLLPAPPPGLTPALATVLRKDAINSEAFTTALVDLGHRGSSSSGRPDPTAGSSTSSCRPARRGRRSAGCPAPAAGRRRGGPRRSRPDAGRRHGDGVLSSDELRKGAGAKLYSTFRKNLGRAAKASPYFRDDPTRFDRPLARAGIGALVLAIVGAVLGVTEEGVDGRTGFRLHAEPMALGLGVIALGAVVIILCSRFLAARTVIGGQALGMALAYRNTLRHIMREAATIESAVAEAQPRLPWIGTPDELAVWATALGLRKEIDDLFKRSLDDTGRLAVRLVAGLVRRRGRSVASFGSVIGSISTSGASSSGSGYGGGSSGGGGGASGGF